MAQESPTLGAATTDGMKAGGDETIAAEAFLSGKAAVQSSRNEKLGRIRGPELQGQIVGLIRATSMLLPNPDFIQNQNIKTRVTDAFVIDVAQYLLALGFTTGQIRSDKVGAILTSAAEAVRGTASANAYAVLSDTVAVAELVSVESTNLNDGFYSTASFRVTDPIKGASSGQILVVRQLSGVLPNGNVQKVSLDATQKEAGQPFILFLSQGLYETATGTNKAAYYLPTMDHANIVGERVLAIPGGDIGDTASVTAALKTISQRSK